MTVDEIKAQMSELGCSDGSCRLRPKRPGQHTNGGCQCVPTVNPQTSEMMAIRASLMRWRQLVDALEAQVKDLESRKERMHQGHIDQDALIAQIGARVVEAEADRDMKVAAIGATLKHAEARAEQSERRLAEVEAERDAANELLGNIAGAELDSPNYVSDATADLARRRFERVNRKGPK